MVQTGLAPWLHGTLTARGGERGGAAVLSAGSAKHRGGLGVVVAACNIVGGGWGQKRVAVGAGGAVEA